MSRSTQQHPMTKHHTQDAPRNRTTANRRRGGGGGHGPLYGLDKSCQQHLSLSIYTLCYSIQKKEGL